MVVRRSSVRAQAGAHSRRDMLWASTAGSMFSPASAQAADASVCDFTVEQYGKRVPMSKFRGEVLVIVNVASE